jgi:hypothetical protein
LKTYGSIFSDVILDNQLEGLEMRIILMGIKEELIGAPLIIQRELPPNAGSDWPCAYRGTINDVHFLPGVVELGRNFPVRIEYTDVCFTNQFPNESDGVWTPLLGGKGPRLVIDVLRDPLFLEVPSELSAGSEEGFGVPSELSAGSEEGFLWGTCDIDTYFNRPSGPYLGKGYFKIVPSKKKIVRIRAIHDLAML